MNIPIFSTSIVLLHPHMNYRCLRKPGCAWHGASFLLLCRFLQYCSISEMREASQTTIGPDKAPVGVGFAEVWFAVCVGLYTVCRVCRLVCSSLYSVQLVQFTSILYCVQVLRVIDWYCVWQVWKDCVSSHKVYCTVMKCALSWNTRLVLSRRPVQCVLGG